MPRGLLLAVLGWTLELLASYRFWCGLERGRSLARRESRCWSEGRSLRRRRLLHGSLVWEQVLTFRKACAWGSWKQFAMRRDAADDGAVLESGSTACGGNKHRRAVVDSGAACGWWLLSPVAQLMAGEA